MISEKICIPMGSRFLPAMGKASSCESSEREWYVVMKGSMACEAEWYAIEAETRKALQQDEDPSVQNDCHAV